VGAFRVVALGDFAQAVVLTKEGPRSVAEERRGSASLLTKREEGVNPRGSTCWQVGRQERQETKCPHDTCVRHHVMWLDLK
jgi:hypothetical protein